MKETKRGPLAWYGGKCNLAKQLIPLIPEHKTYVEVFAGGAALLWAKPPSPVEVINDLNSGLFNFYQVLSDPEIFARFQIRVELMPYSREEYAYCKKTWEDVEDEVERAARWFVVARQCFSAVFGAGWACSKKEARNGVSQSVSKYLSAISRLPEVHDRIRGVQVENADFRTIINRYDFPGAFFYLDPPYVLGTRKAKKVYEHEMTDEDHEDLIELLLSIKGKAMLSGYANPIYGPLECAGWKRYDFEATCSAGVNSIRKAGADDEELRQKLARVETIWLKN